MEALSRSGAAPKGQERIDPYVDSIAGGIRLRVRQKRPRRLRPERRAARLGGLRESEEVPFRIVRSRKEFPCPFYPRPRSSAGV